MDKLRFRLLICLIIIFAVTLVGFVIALVGGSDHGIVSGAAVSGGESRTPTTLAMFLPGMLFIGLLILTIIYLERN